MTLDRECDQCGARPGRPCLAPSGRVAARIHVTRISGQRRSLESAEANRVRARARYHERKTTNGTTA